MIPIDSTHQDLSFDMLQDKFLKKIECSKNQQ